MMAWSQRILLLVYFPICVPIVLIFMVQFREYLEANGFDTSPMGVNAASETWSGSEKDVAGEEKQV
jgi:hypothetical protein